MKTALAQNIEYAEARRTAAEAKFLMAEQMISVV